MKSQRVSKMYNNLTYYLHGFHKDRLDQGSPEESQLVQQSYQQKCYSLKYVT